jgi:glutathione S-transferase
MTDTHTLYAFPHSLYSGRARSYLIKNGIPFRELSTGHESFKADILPKARLPTIPTLLTTEGEVIRDGAAIIEHFEAASGRPCQPRTPRQQVASALFDLIGTDGLLRPAMHYRWNFPDENLAFVRFHFLYSQRETPEREAKTERMMDKMRHAGAAFGVSEATAPLVESLYLEFLSALDAHLARVPYLLGWKPCIGDFGLLAPLYAHLGRDPKPAAIMQREAVRVWRWVERMNRADQDAPEFFEAGTDYLTDDEIPDTLLAVLRILAEDLVPETRAAAACINQWLADNRPAPGTPAERFLAMAQFSVRGQAITAVAQPYRFCMLQRVQDIHAGLDDSARARVENMFAFCGLSEMLTIRLDRRLGRAENLEVWL